MTPEKIAELTALCEKAAPGPWRVGPVDDTRVEDAAGNEVAQIDGDYNQPDTWPQMEANAAFIAAARTALPELLAEVTRITREQQEERADWYRFGTFMSQFDLGDKDGGTDAVVDSWIERITRLTRERDEAFNAGIDAAANVSIGSVARLPRITNTHKIAEICQFDPLQGWITKEDVIRYGSEITDGIRELKKPATGQATGEK